MLQGAEVSVGTFVTHNLIPATLGNIVGGAFFCRRARLGGLMVNNKLLLSQHLRSAHSPSSSQRIDFSSSSSIRRERASDFSCNWVAKSLPEDKSASKAAFSASRRGNGFVECFKLLFLLKRQAPTLRCLGRVGRFFGFLCRLVGTFSRKGPLFFTLSFRLPSAIIGITTREILDADRLLQRPRHDRPPYPEHSDRATRQ